jgi:hypothetical protein
MYYCNKVGTPRTRFFEVFPWAAFQNHCWRLVTSNKTLEELNAEGEDDDDDDEEQYSEILLILIFGIFTRILIRPPVCGGWRIRLFLTHQSTTPTLCESNNAIP